MEEIVTQRFIGPVGLMLLMYALGTVGAFCFAWLFKRTWEFAPIHRNACARGGLSPTAV